MDHPFFTAHLEMRHILRNIVQICTNGEDKFGVREQRRVGICDKNVGFFSLPTSSQVAHQMFAAKISPIIFAI